MRSGSKTTCWIALRMRVSSACIRHRIALVGYFELVGAKRGNVWERQIPLLASPQGGESASLKLLDILCSPRFRTACEVPNHMRDPAQRSRAPVKIHVHRTGNG